MRYQWIVHMLGNELIDVKEIMAPFADEVLEHSTEGGRTIAAIINRRKVNDIHQILLVSLRVGERALPLVWHMKKTLGATALSQTEKRLHAVAAVPPYRGTCNADGRPPLWLTGLDRMVPRAWLMLAFAV